MMQRITTGLQASQQEILCATARRPINDDATADEVEVRLCLK